MSETNGRATLGEVRDLIADVKDASKDQHNETLREIGKLGDGQLRHARQIANLQMRVAMVTKTCKERPALCALQHRESRREDELRAGVDERQSRRHSDPPGFEWGEGTANVLTTERRVWVMWAIFIFAATLAAGGVVDLIATMLAHHWWGF